MKYQLITTDGKDIIEKSELVLNEGDKLVVTVSTYNNAPPSVEQVTKWHNHFKGVLENSDTVITKPTHIELSVLKVTQ